MPWAYALYCFLHLRSLDRRRGWMERMSRIVAAEHLAQAMHDPARLADERRLAIAAAGPMISMSDAEIVAYGRSLAANIARDRLVS